MGGGDGGTGTGTGGGAGWPGSSGAGPLFPPRSGAGGRMYRGRSLRGRPAGPVLGGVGGAEDLRRPAGVSGPPAAGLGL